MTLRKATRDIIRKGSFVNAVVEATNHGLATVRFGDGQGQRLTNLRVIGDAVAVGQSVVVDYSSGPPPTVHPIIESPVEELDLQPGQMIPRPPETRDDDLSCHVSDDWWPMETQYNQKGDTWHTFKFGGNGYAIPGYSGWDIHPFPDPVCWEYDNAGFIANKYAYITYFLTVPISGKYLITYCMNPYTHGEDYMGTFEMEIRRNGTVIAEYGGLGVHYDDDQGRPMYAFDHFEEGDKVDFRYRWLTDRRENSASIDFMWYNSGNWSWKQYITVNYWPGTGTGG